VVNRWIWLSVRAFLFLAIVLVPTIGLGVVANQPTSFGPHARGVLAEPLAANNNNSNNNNNNNNNDNGSCDNNNNGNSNNNGNTNLNDNNDNNNNNNNNSSCENDNVPTPIPTPPPVCTPRPPVSVTTTPSGNGQLLVTIAASGANNSLAQLQFQNTTNALVDIRGQTGLQGTFTVNLPDRPQQITFAVRRATAGSAVTVPIIVVDGCGSWNTLVGGGPNAF